jgi:hypothetical protein
LITNLSQKEAAAFMANRRGHGMNTLWINLLCIFTHASCNREAKTFDGIVPFLVPGDIATPNPVYFQRVDKVLRIAANHGMVVLLDPIETVSWLDILRKNGKSKAFEYGQYLGNRYSDFPNINWMHGNDFQSWRNAADDALVQAVARGYRCKPHPLRLLSRHHRPCEARSPLGSNCDIASSPAHVRSFRHPQQRTFVESGVLGPSSG